MFTKPRYVNEIGGILLQQPDGVDLYVDGGDVHERAKSGAYGTVDPYIPPPIDPSQLASAARVHRNALLAASDWTQVADAPVNQAAWATYRQALRDLPDQAGFPTDINWPVAPE